MSKGLKRLRSSGTTVIPIASGKGGVGKSLVAANLAIALAGQGHSTIAVDMDLGGSNLYTYLGVPNSNPGIGDFLKSGGCRFQDLVVPTGIPNLSFVPGDGLTPFMANIDHDQRVALSREIRQLSARFVILDLGAGTFFNTLNFFGLSRQGIVVTTFETPAMMNFVMFLRNFMFRVVSGLTRRNRAAFSAVIEAFHQPVRSAPVTVEALIRRIDRVDPPLAARVKSVCESYRPRIVFNMGDHPDELNVLRKVDHSLRNGLSLTADYLGFIYYDDVVRRAAKNREILMTRHPSSAAVQGIREIAQRLTGARAEDTLSGIGHLQQTARDTYRRLSASGLSEARL